MNKPKIILVDMDGVLADFTGHFLTTWEKEHPGLFTLRREELTEHDPEVLFPQTHREALRAISLREGFFRELPPIAGGKEALEEMRMLGLDVRICTSPKKAYRHCVREKFEWVDEHLGEDWTERIVLTRDKTLVHGDFLIDDKPEVSGVGIPTWEHVYYDQPYNQARDKRRLTWNNWKEVICT